MDASQVPESRRRPPQNMPHPKSAMFHCGAEAEHPQNALDEFGVRLIAAELAGRGAVDATDLKEVIIYLGFLVEDFRRLQAAVQLWFLQNCPRLGLDMGPTPASPAHVSGPFNQILNDLDSRAHTLAIRELSARTFNVQMDLEEAATYAGVELVEGGDPDTARLEHLEKAVGRARATLAAIARDLLLSVGITPENGGDDA